MPHSNLFYTDDRVFNPNNDIVDAINNTLQHTRMKTINSTTDDSVELNCSIRFKFPDQLPELLAHLDVHGYAVVGEVLKSDEVEHAKELFWQYIDQINGDSDSDSESDEDDDRILRYKPQTWNYWPGDHFNGIISGGRFCHSNFLWYLRQHPVVQEVFSAIWNLDVKELLTSYDRGSTFRPWQQYNKAWKTKGGWWHIDQNSLKGPTRTGRVSIQSLVTMYDVNESTGGFAAIPGSHHFNEELSEQFAKHESIQIDHVYVNLSENSNIMPLKKILVGAKAGDMILWDSRTIHCNVPAFTNNNPQLPIGELLRLVGYVCMQPKSAAPEGSGTNKKLALLCQIPSSHWAIEHINTSLILSAIQSNPSKALENAQRIFANCSDLKLSICGFTDDDINLGKDNFECLWDSLLQQLV